MIELILKKHLKTDGKNISQVDRSEIAKKCSLFGIFLNVILFAIKFLAGTLSNSVAITSDAFNNLSDAGSSLITLIGIHLSLKKPDPEHPFGHGRIEYLSGLAVSIMIILMGFELAKEAFFKILEPTPNKAENLSITLIILFVSVLIKLYMWFYNKNFGKKISSTAMLACATDSLSDCFATFVVLCTTVIALRFNLPLLDGICGFIVSALIFVAGIRSVRETLVPLLGQPAERELLKNIEQLVLKEDQIVGIHDLIVHDYGPGRKMASLHAEVPFDCSIFEIHDLIDNVEAEIKSKFGCDTVIHMDPVDYNDPKTLVLREDLAKILQENFPEVSFHDFRVVHGKTHTNLIFDIVKPYSLKTSSKDICETIKYKMKQLHENHNCVIQVDHDYTAE